MFAAGSCVAAGVALVGAGVIAVAPVEPPPTAARSVNASVHLAAIPSPLELYPQVFSTAFENTAALAAAYFADPFPLTRLTVRNQILALAEAVESLAAGDVGAAVGAVGDAIVQPFKTVIGAFEYIDVLLDQPGAPEALFQIIFSPVLGGFAAAGVAIGEVIDAAVALDLVGLVNAVINIPARILDGVLNGGYGSPFGNFDTLPGLLTPLTVEGYLFPGPIALAINIDQDAADYIDEQAGQTAASQTDDIVVNSLADQPDSTGTLDDADEAEPVEVDLVSEDLVPVASTDDGVAADEVLVDELSAEADPGPIDAPDEIAGDSDDGVAADDDQSDDDQDDDDLDDDQDDDQADDDAGDSAGTEGVQDTD